MRLRRRTEGARALAPGAAAVLVLALLVVAGLAAPAGAPTSMRDWWPRARCSMPIASPTSPTG